MKNLKLLLIALLLFSSCDKINELMTLSLTTTIESEFTINPNDFAIIPSDFLAVETKASAFNYDLNHEIKISDNEILNPYLNHIKELNITSVEITFNDLDEGDIIDFISLVVKDAGSLLSLTNITKENNYFKITPDQTVINAISKQLLNDKKIVLNIAGGTNGQFGFSTSLKLGVKAKVEVLSK